MRETRSVRTIAESSLTAACKPARQASTSLSVSLARRISSHRARRHSWVQMSRWNADYPRSDRRGTVSRHTTFRSLSSTISSPPPVADSRSRAASIAALCVAYAVIDSHGPECPSSRHACALRAHQHRPFRYLPAATTADEDQSRSPAARRKEPPGEQVLNNPGTHRVLDRHATQGRTRAAPLPQSHRPTGGEVTRSRSNIMRERSVHPAAATRSLAPLPGPD